MRKIFVLCVAILIVPAMLAGCTSSNTQSKNASDAGTGVVETSTSSKQSGTTVSSSAGFSVEKVASNIDVQIYSLIISYSNYAIMVLTDNSDFDCQLDVSVDFYDGYGNIVGVDSGRIDAFAKGTANVLRFSCDDSFGKIEYKLKPTEISSYYVPVNQNLSCTINIATNKAIISATNNGTIPAEFVEYYALFFSGEELIDYDWGYITDSDSEIKAGDTIREEASCHKNFDSVQVYLNGRGSK